MDWYRVMTEENYKRYLQDKSHELGAILLAMYAEGYREVKLGKAAMNFIENGVNPYVVEDE